MRKNIKSYDYARTSYKDINKQIANIGLTKYKEGLNKQQQLLQGIPKNDIDDSEQNIASSTDPIVKIQTSKKPLYAKSSIITSTPKIAINQSSLVSEFITTSRYLNDEVMVIMSDLDIQSKSEFYGGAESDDEGDDAQGDDDDDDDDDQGDDDQGDDDQGDDAQEDDAQGDDVNITELEAKINNIVSLIKYHKII
jgi:hypothetical protein